MYSGGLIGAAVFGGVSLVIWLTKDDLALVGQIVFVVAMLAMVCGVTDCDPVKMLVGAGSTAVAGYIFYRFYVYIIFAGLAGALVVAPLFMIYTIITQ